MIPENWLVWAAVAIASSQGALVLVLVVRNAWVEWRLRRLSGRSRLLEDIFAELGAGSSATVRAEIGRREILADIRALEQWLDLVVGRGEDPACLSPTEYEVGGIVERYLTALRTERRWVRRAAAAEILGWTRSPRAVSALLATALDTVGEPPPVRQVALRSLERIHHPDAAPEMIAALETAETWFLPRAAGVLARIGEGAVEPLIDELSDRNRPASSRRWAAQILGEIGDRRAVPTLQNALGDVDPELRARAAKALGRLRDPSSVSALLQRLVNDPSSFVRTSVASALGQLPTRETVEFLARSLSDPEWWVRLRAVESLAGLGSPARDTLRGALHDRDPSVAREAARALERMGVVEEAIDTMKADGYTPEVAELLHDVGVAGSLDTMLDALRDADDTLATQLVRILGRIGDRRAGPGLAASLARADNPALETRLIQALHRVGASGFDDEVAPKLASPDEWVRVSCLGYLEELGDAERLPDLTALLNEPLAGVRCAALRAVKRMRPVDFPAETVVRLLGDLDPSVRAAAARALGALGRHDLLLQHGIQGDKDSVITALIAALGPARGAASVRLALALFARAKDEELERLAAHVRDAAHQHPEETLDVLRGQTDTASRWAMATAAGALMPAGVPVDLRAYLDDEDARVRAAAVQNALLVEDGALLGIVAARCADRSPLVAVSAVRALANVPGANVDDRLMAALRRGDPRVVVDVALALGMRGGLRGKARALLGRLDEEPLVHLATTVARLWQEDAEALPVWLRALEDLGHLRTLRSWRERSHPLFSAMVGLAESPETPFLARFVGTDSTYAAELLLLHELERCPEPETRLACVAGLRDLKSRRADGVLVSTCLVDPDPAVRSAALEFLVTQSRHPQKLGLIEHALRDPEESVRILAARRTAELHPGEAIPLLLRHVESGRTRFLHEVCEVLARHADDYLPAILKSLTAAPENERRLRAAAMILGRATLPVPEDTASALLRHRWAPVRAQAVRDLVPRRGRDGPDLLLRGMTDPASEVRLASVTLLADPSLRFHEREPERSAALLAAVEDPSGRVRVRAIRALPEFRPRGATAALRRASRTGDARVAQVAAEALERLSALSASPSGSAT